MGNTEMGTGKTQPVFPWGTVMNWGRKTAGEAREKGPGQTNGGEKSDNFDARRRWHLYRCNDGMDKT